MTDNEIIKALGCHKEQELATCKNCPLLNIDGCAYELSEYALSLINRQKLEINHLQNDVNALEILLERAKVTAIKEFAERLCEDRVSNDPVVIAVKCELKEMVGEDK